METKYMMTVLNKATGKLETFDQRTGELVALEGMSIPERAYSLEMADAICNLVREGHTYKEISEISGMPRLHQIHAWVETYPDFAKRVKQARKSRASWFHDEAVQVIKDSATIEKDEVAREKFRFDGLMRLAEVGDSDTYGKKTAGQGSAGPTTIVINTGIRREQVIEVSNEQISSEEFSEDGRRETVDHGGIHQGNPAAVEIRFGAEVDDGTGDEGASVGSYRVTEIDSSEEEDQEEGF